MKGDCYPNLVEVFYTNLRVLNGVIHSRVKGVNITIDDNVWSDITGLKAEGLDSHIRDSDSNKWLTKTTIYISNKYLHDGLNKEEKVIALCPDLATATWKICRGQNVNRRCISVECYQD
ncbi:hypothetical protein LR48_Vigan03g164500 [Vigna angularis]|uniref:Uncharacterized protein n=1 Tax=Phaseolus angularis TaxID=3914 RepID=A0A0L9U607_PHAAN|nr:hypothetical protein LR48_Vigan03g164500 [Vigna angularis]